MAPQGRINLGLPPPPTFAEAMQLSKSGIVLGNGTVIAPLAFLSAERAKLVLAGNEERIIALLSIAFRKSFGVEILRKLSSVSSALMRGETSLAAIMLCQADFPRLADQRAADFLEQAAWRLHCGATPHDLLKLDGLLPYDRPSDAVEKFNPDQPRDEYGRWTSSGQVELAATTQNFGYACKKLGLDPNDTSDAYHALKEHMGLGGANNCVFDLENGDIFYNGEWIGNVFHL